MKKITLFIPFLILTFAISLLAGCDSSRDPQWEASKKALIEEFFASAQGIAHGDITVDSTKKSVTIANLKVEKNIVDEKGQNLLSLTIEADKLFASNVNFVDAPSGVIDLAEKAQLTNAKYTITVDPALLEILNIPLDPTDLNSTAMVQEVALEKIRDDASLFFKTVAEKNLPVAQLLPLREKFYIASVSAKNISSTHRFNNKTIPFDVFGSDHKKNADMKTTITEVRFKDFTIEGLRDYLLTNYIGEIEGKKILSLESVAIKNISVPNIVATIASKSKEKLYAQEISIEGVNYKNMQLFPPVGDITVKGIEGNFVKKQGQLTFTTAYKNIVLSPDFLDDAFQKARIGKFSEFYNKPLDLTAIVDLKGTLEENGDAKLTVSSLELNEANLGKVNLQLGLEGKNFKITPTEVFPRNNFDVKASSAKLTLQDKGIIDFGFAFAAMSQNNAPLAQAKESGKAMRTLISNMFPGTCARSIGAANKSFCDEFAKIVKEPGTLDISLNPKSPLPLDFSLLGVLEDLQGAGLTVKYTK